MVIRKLARIFVLRLGVPIFPAHPSEQEKPKYLLEIPNHKLREQDGCQEMYPDLRVFRYFYWKRSQKMLRKKIPFAVHHTAFSIRAKKKKVSIGCWRRNNAFAPGIPGLLRHAFRPDLQRAAKPVQTHKFLCLEGGRALERLYTCERKLSSTGNADQTPNLRPDLLPTPGWKFTTIPVRTLLPEP